MAERNSKTTFTGEELKRIISLVRELETADSSKQKGIRAKIRKIGLFWSEVAPGLTYTVANLKKLFEEEILKLTDYEKYDLESSTPKNEIKEQPPVKLRQIKISPVHGLDQYRADGFEGFMPVSMLRENTCDLPDEAGVYVVIRTTKTKPQFLEVGTGGFFKGKDPNVSIEELTANYVEDAHTVYIGKAGTSLRRRVGQLLSFGEGSPVGHWGGRYLWQLADSAGLLVAWKTTPGCDPRIVEAKMIQDFVSTYGKRPFANLKD